MDEIEQHKRFDIEVQSYINDCLDNCTSPEIILESFRLYIDVELKKRQ